MPSSTLGQQIASNLDTKSTKPLDITNFEGTRLPSEYGFSIYEYDEFGMIKDARQVTSPDEARRLYEAGKMNVEQIKLAKAYSLLATKGVLDLDKEDAIVLYKAGYLKPKDIIELDSYQKSPTKYYLLGALENIGKGVVDFGVESLQTLATINPAQIALSQLTERLTDGKLNPREAILDNLESISKSESMSKSNSNILNATRGIAQFLAGFVPANKALQGVKAFANPTLNTSVNAGVAGAISDVLGRDEKEARLSDLVESVPELRNPITEFLKSDKNDSFIEAKTKTALEGMGLGFAFDGLFYALRSLKSNIWSSSHGYEPSVVSKVDEMLGKQENPKPTPKEPEVPKSPQPATDESVEQVIKESELDKSFTSRIVSADDFSKAIEAEKEALAKSKGVVTHDEVRRMASEFDVDLELIKKTYEDTTQLNARVVAIGNTINKFKDDLMSEIKLYREAVSKGTDDVLTELELFAKIKQHGAMQGGFKAISANIARGLNAHKLITNTKQIDLKGIDKIELDEIISQSGGRTELRNAINAFYDTMLNNASKANAYSRGLVRATWRDWAEALRLGGMLSSPATHIANVLGSLVSMTSKEFEHTLSLTGQAVAKRSLTPFKEMYAKHLGYYLAFTDAFKKGEPYQGTFIKSLTQAKPILDINQRWIDSASAKFRGIAHHFENLDYKAGKASLRQASPKQLIHESLVDIGFLGVFRSLTATDELFKNISYRGEVYRKAMEEFNKEGRVFATRKELAEELHNIFKSGWETRDKRGIAVARENTFTTPLHTQIEIDKTVNPISYQLAQLGTSIDQLALYIQGARNSQNLPLRWMAKAMFPFVNTPTNIFKEALRHTPLAVFSRKWQADYLAGGTRRGMAVAKMVLGASYMAATHELYKNNLIIGKPSKEERAIYNLANIPDYSIRVGDTWVSYEKIEPISTLIGLAVNAFNAWDKHELKDEEEQGLAELTMMLSTAVMDTMIDKSYMKGLQSVVAMNENFADERRANSFINQLAQSFMPLGSAVRSHLGDNTKVQKESVIDVFNEYLSLLGLSDKDSLTPVLNLFGEKTTKMPKFGAFAPYGKVSDPLVAELAKVGFNYDPLRQKALEFGQSRFLVDAKEKNEIKKIVKELGLRQMLEQVVSNQKYQDLVNIEDKRRVLQSISSDIYGKAIQLYITKNPENIEKIKRDALKKAEERTDALKANEFNKGRVPVFMRNIKESDDR